MAVIRERVSASGTKSYHVQVRIKGFPPQTKTFPNKTMAKDWAAMVQTELFEAILALQEADEVGEDGEKADPGERVALLSKAAKNIATLTRWT